jgi:hypothetical protein
MEKGRVKFGDSVVKSKARGTDKANAITIAKVNVGYYNC